MDSAGRKECFMKRKIAFFLCILLLSCLFYGCSKAATSSATAPEDMQSRFQSAYDQMQPQLPEMMEIPPEMVTDYYGIERDDYKAGIFMISLDNMLADEVVMLQAIDSAAADRIETMLNERLQAKADEAESYSPEQYAIITGCKVLRNGETLSLLVSADYSGMVAIYNTEIQ